MPPKPALTVPGYNWFGWFNNAGDTPYFTSITEVYPRLKLIRLIPNWDNLNNIPLANRSWDGSIYQSKNSSGNLQSYISSDLMYSRHWKTGKLFAVFNTTGGKIKLNPGETITSIQSTDGYFIEAGDASADLIVTANSTGAEITLSSSVAIPVDSTNGQVKGVGYILTISSTSDTTAPSVAITSPTANATYSTTTSTISLSGSASDIGSGLNTITYTLNSGTPVTAIGTTNWSTPNLSLQSGINTIVVTAQDQAGNSSTDTLTVTYTIPTPGTIALSASTYSTAENSGSITITAARTGGKLWHRQHPILNQ